MVLRWQHILYQVKNGFGLATYFILGKNGFGGQRREHQAGDRARSTRLAWSWGNMAGVVYVYVLFVMRRRRGGEEERRGRKEGMHGTDSLKI